MTFSGHDDSTINIVLGLLLLLLMCNIQKNIFLHNSHLPCRQHGRGLVTVSVGSARVPPWHGARRLSRLERQRLVGAVGQRGSSAEPGAMCSDPGQHVAVSRHRLLADASAQPARPRLPARGHPTSSQVRPAYTCLVLIAEKGKAMVTGGVGPGCWGSGPPENM